MGHVNQVKKNIHQTFIDSFQSEFDKWMLGCRFTFLEILDGTPQIVRQMYEFWLWKFSEWIKNIVINVLKEPSS